MKVQKTLRLALGAGLFTSLLQLAPAQVTASYTLLLSEGDAMPGFPGELITRIDDVDVNGNGDWLAEVATDGATAQNTYVVHNGNTIWVESGNLGFTAPVGGIAGGFMDTMQINDNGDILLVFPLTHPVNGSITVMTVNGVTVIDAKTTVCGAANVPAGTIYDSISEAWMNNNNQLLVACRLLVPGATSSVDALVRMDINGTGGIVSETKIAMVGETLPGPNHVTPIQGFSFSKARQAINDNGDFIWYVDDDHTVAPGSTLTDSNMYINNTLLYNEADPFPLDPVNAFEHFSTCEVDLNDAGDFVFSGFDSGDNAEDSWIFKSIGGTPTMIAHESEACPAAMGPYLTAGFGFGGLVPMSDSGDVLWYIDTDSTDTTTDQGVFYNDTLVCRENTTVLSGQTVTSVPDGDTEIAMSDDGKIAVFEVVLGTTIDALYRVDFLPPAGVTFCDPADVNSTGAPAVLSASFGTGVGSDLHLEGTGGPTGEFGYILVGAGSVDPGVLLPQGGHLCLDTALPIGRYNLAGTGGSVGQFDASGVLQNLVGTSTVGSGFDVPSNLPTTGSPAIMSGETWYFQLWYRDTPAGVGMANLSNGLAVTFP